MKRLVTVLVMAVILTASPAYAHHNPNGFRQEDGPVWDCRFDGNHVCGILKYGWRF